MQNLRLYLLPWLTFLDFKKTNLFHFDLDKRIYIIYFRGILNKCLALGRIFICEYVVSVSIVCQPSFSDIMASFSRCTREPLFPLFLSPCLSSSPYSSSIFNDEIALSGRAR